MKNWIDEKIHHMIRDTSETTEHATVGPRMKHYTVL